MLNKMNLQKKKTAVAEISIGLSYKTRLNINYAE